MMASQTRNSSTSKAIARYKQEFSAFLSNLPHNKGLELESETKPVSKTKSANNHMFIETDNYNTSEKEEIPNDPLSTAFDKFNQIYAPFLSNFYKRGELESETKPSDNHMFIETVNNNTSKLEEIPKEPLSSVVKFSAREKYQKIEEGAKTDYDEGSTSKAKHETFRKKKLFKGEPKCPPQSDELDEEYEFYATRIQERMRKYNNMLKFWTKTINKETVSDSSGDDSLEDDNDSYKSYSEDSFRLLGSDFDSDDKDDEEQKKCEDPSSSVMMSSAEDTSCFTVTWEIENYSLLLESTENILRSPSWKTNTTEECAWWRLSASHSVFYALFDLSRFMGSTVLNQCQLFLITSSGEIPLEKDGSDLKFYIEINSILGDNGKSKFPNDTLTLCCKMWKKTMKTGEYRPHSVLHKVNYSWDNKKGSSGARDYIFNEQSNFLLYINVQEMRKKGTHKVTVGSVPRGDICVSIVDCDLTSTDGYIVNKECVFPFVSCICDIERNKGSSLQFQLECIFAVHNSKSSHDSSSTLSNDLLQVYQEKAFSDATLITEGKSFSANRSILAARSQVFSTMLKDQTSEDGSGVLIIEDIDSATLGRMLVFLYSDSLEEVNWEEAAALYYAADKYAVPYLKQKCADVLKAGLALDNACQALILADKYSDQELMKCTVDFIRDHTEVISSAKWEKLEESNSKLALKCFRGVIVKK